VRYFVVFTATTFAGGLLATVRLRERYSIGEQVDRNTKSPPSPKPSNSNNSESSGVCDAVSQQSMILVMVRILKNKPFQRARRAGTVECLPLGETLKMLSQLANNAPH
jgi:hypothetical protein